MMENIRYMGFLCAIYASTRSKVITGAEESRELTAKLNKLKKGNRTIHRFYE